MPRHDREIVPALAELIGARLDELELSPTAFAESTGLTVQGLAPLRRGERRAYQKRLTGPVTRVLGWTPDSIERILDGDEPAPVAPPDDGMAAEPGRADLMAQIETLTDEIRALRGPDRATGDGPASLTDLHASIEAVRASLDPLIEIADRMADQLLVVAQALPPGALAAAGAPARSSR